MGGRGGGPLPVNGTIAWWGWLTLWSALVLGLLVMLGAFAWVLFRKGLGVLDAVAHLADSAAVLDAEERALTPPQRAILADLRDIRAREAARRFRRAERRRQRLDRRLARARHITTLDASRHPWPTDWYRSARSRPERVSLSHSHPHSEGS
jgi:hypothetical protein